jgi:hypothetical protein
MMEKRRCRREGAQTSQEWPDVISTIHAASLCLLPPNHCPLLQRLLFTCHLEQVRAGDSLQCTPRQSKAFTDSHAQNKLRLTLNNASNDALSLSMLPRPLVLKPKPL